MWLSKKQVTPAPEPEAAQLGVATIAGDPTGVFLGTERRSLPLVSPGGYHWTPQAGEELLVVKQGEQGYVVGAAQEQSALAPGEVSLSAPGGAAVTLKRDGVLRLDGTVLINGETVEKIVGRMLGGLL